MIPEPPTVPAAYGAEVGDEMFMGGMAVLLTARERLVAHFGFDPQLCRTVVGVLDELAAEMVTDELDVLGHDVVDTPITT